MILGLLMRGTYGETFICPDLQEMQTKLFLRNPQLWLKWTSIYKGVQKSCLISYLIMVMMMIMMKMMMIDDIITIKQVGT